MPVLTISRQSGSLGNEIAAALAERLGWELIHRGDAIARFLVGIAGPGERHLLKESARQYLVPASGGLTYLEHLERNLREHVREHPVVLVGFGSQAIFAGDRDAIHVRIGAPRDVRIDRLRLWFGMSPAEAGTNLDTADRKQRRFASAVFGIDIDDPDHYHLTLNTAVLSVEECVSAILALQERRSSRMAREASSSGWKADAEFVFKHPSEAEFARILDMYGIEWSYEPRTFPVEWDAEGNVTAAFRPDFHLTRFGTYIELTTMDQKYISMKNRKLKKLRELYPGVDVRIVYKKDFHTLVERFGRVGDA